MKILRYWALGLALVVMSLTSLEAQTSEPHKAKGWLSLPDPAERTYSLRRTTNYLGLGGLSLRDDYLSPLPYGGMQLSYIREQMHLGYSRLRGEARDPSILAVRPRMVNPERLWYWSGELHLGSTQNPAGNAAIYRMMGRLEGNYAYRIYSDAQSQLFMGPGLTAALGGLYSTRNDNNPATLKAEASLTLGLHYGYRLPWQSFPALLRLTTQADLLGLHFGQGYRESYYELYYISRQMSKRLHLEHLGSGWGHRLLVGLDLPVWDRFTASVGYRWEYHSSRLNQTLYRLSGHTLMLGVTVHSLPIGGRKALERHRAHLPL